MSRRPQARQLTAPGGRGPARPPSKFNIKPVARAATYAVLSADRGGHAEGEKEEPVNNINNGTPGTINTFLLPYNKTNLRGHRKPRKIYVSGNILK